MSKSQAKELKEEVCNNEKVDVTLQTQKMQK